MSDTHDYLLLDQQLCFAIYSTTHAFNRAYKPLLEPLGLTYPQYLVLMVLWERDGQTVGGIGEKLLLDSSTLTPLLKRMEKAGFITRKRSASDERALIVSLTQVGRAIRERCKQNPISLRCAIGSTDKDIEALRTAVLGVREALNTHAPR